MSTSYANLKGECSRWFLRNCKGLADAMVIAIVEMPFQSVTTAKSAATSADALLCFRKREGFGVGRNSPEMTLREQDTLAPPTSRLIVAAWTRVGPQMARKVRRTLVALFPATLGTDVPGRAARSSK